MQMRRAMKGAKRITRDVPVVVRNRRKLSREINDGLSDAKVMARLTEPGGEEFAGSAGDFGEFIAAETENWGKVIKFANIKSE